MKHLVILLLLTFTAFSMQAQKFGFINSQELIQNIPEVKEANSNIETYKNQLQKKGQEMIQSLQAKYADLGKKQQNGEMSPKQIEIETQALKTQEGKIGQFEQDSQKKIFDKSETLLAPLREKIQKAIDEVASENGFDYIFDASLGLILFADDTADVGSLVKAKLGL